MEFLRFVAPLAFACHFRSFIIIVVRRSTTSLLYMNMSIAMCLCLAWGAPCRRCRCSKCPTCYHVVDMHVCVCTTVYTIACPHRPQPILRSWFMGYRTLFTWCDAKFIFDLSGNLNRHTAYGELLRRSEDKRWAQRKWKKKTKTNLIPSAENINKNTYFEKYVSMNWEDGNSDDMLPWYHRCHRRCSTQYDNGLTSDYSAQHRVSSCLELSKLHHYARY